jgi:hypothetical protein
MRYLWRSLIADVAQLVEHVLGKDEVTGSIPVIGSKRGYNSCMATKYCESCMMPLDKDSGVRESEKYCSLCFRDGKLLYEGDDLKEFQRIVYNAMRSHAANPLFARFAVWMIRFAPRWKKR